MISLHALWLQNLLLTFSWWVNVLLSQHLKVAGVKLGMFYPHIIFFSEWIKTNFGAKCFIVVVRSQQADWIKLHIHKHALTIETQIKQINIFKNSVSSENFYVFLMNKRQWKKQHHCPSVWAQSFSRTSVLTDSFSGLDGCYLNQTQTLLLGNKSEFWDFSFKLKNSFPTQKQDAIYCTVWD